MDGDADEDVVTGVGTDCDPEATRDKEDREEQPGQHAEQEHGGLNWPLAVRPDVMRGRKHHGTEQRRNRHRNYARQQDSQQDAADRKQPEAEQHFLVNPRADERDELAERGRLDRDVRERDAGMFEQHQEVSAECPEQNGVDGTFDQHAEDRREQPRGPTFSFD